ncbi:MAG: hypothetical protein ACKPKO_13635, partial [Candidatus Fonsibacter sp.]
MVDQFVSIHCYIYTFLKYYFFDQIPIVNPSPEIIVYLPKLLSVIQTLINGDGCYSVQGKSNWTFEAFIYRAYTHTAFE